MSGEDIRALFDPRQPKVLVGCAPCEPFSTYSRSRADGKRPLLPEFARLVAEAEPDVVLMENVARLTIPAQDRAISLRKAALLQTFPPGYEFFPADQPWSLTAAARAQRRRHPYEMNLDLYVLNHLGINLYSNNPAVLAEAVANAWDADAQTVRIDIDKAAGTVVIADDGHGMSESDINSKFLRVGRRRRDDVPRTPRRGRPVMGRKGIGKLSLFSIADTIEVQSAKDGQRVGFTMSRPAIEAQIKGQTKGKEGGGTYFPEPLADDRLVVTQGTRIELRDLRKRLTTTRPTSPPQPPSADRG